MGARTRGAAPYYVTGGAGGESEARLTQPTAATST